MGEYIMYEGTQWKIGTCESMYYITYNALEWLVQQNLVSQAPANLPPADYLNPEYGFLYRFPFPDEDDNGAFYTGYEYDRGWLVSHMPYHLFQAETHGSVYADIETRHSHLPKGRQSIACPQSPDLNAATVEVEIYGQKRVGTKLHLLVRCPYCGKIWSMDESEGRAMGEWLMETSEPGDELAVIAERIIAGYDNEHGL